MMKVSIVLPTYNERENIIQLISKLKEQLIKKFEYEIIVVDDNSPDKTWQLIENYQKIDSNIQLILRADERGLTSALNSGLSVSTGDLIVWMDCDLSHPPELLTSLISEISDYDAVIASRFIKGGKDDRDGKYFFQKILSLFLSKLFYFVTRNPVKDISSGYIIIKSKWLKNTLPLEGDYGEYFIDLICRLHRANCRIKEIPYSFVNRKFGESKTSTNILGYFFRGKKYLKTTLNYHRWQH